ncbi:LPD38 domain-containing protein [Marinobacter salarius]|uniref:LPD38 domain-containing protein n=1 Tax=Marinobacter salarius TaxID=1420917 RepID=UPI003D0FD328
MANAFDRFDSVAEPELRPFQPGEQVDNGDGSFSTERTVTVPIGRRWANVPSLWMSPDGPKELDEDAAVRAAMDYERATGTKFPGFDSVDEAVASAKARSDKGGANQGSITSAQGNPFDAFDDQPEIQPSAPTETDDGPGLFSNSLRNAGERGFDLLGNAVQFVGNIFEKGNEAFKDVTGLEVRRPKLPLLPDDYASSRRAIDAGQEIEDQSLGYKPNFTIDKALDEPTLRNLAGAVAEQGPAALSDMAALIISTPAYLASRTQEIGEARVENDGGDMRNASPELQKAIVDNFANGTEIPEELQREAEQLAQNGGMPELKDYLVAGPTAAASVLLDRFALGKLLPGGGKAITSARQVPGAVGRAAVTEATTEAVQEGGIEYAGESVGTKTGYDPTTAGRRAAGGALVGGPTGGVVRGGTASYEAATAKPGQSAADRESVGEGARMDAEPGQEGAVVPGQSGAGNAFDQFDEQAEVISPEPTVEAQSAEPPVLEAPAEQKSAPVSDIESIEDDQARRAANYYRPGRVIKAPMGGGFEVVESFDPGDSKAPWSVKVRASDEHGNPLDPRTTNLDSRTREHSTMPPTFLMKQWEQGNPVPDYDEVYSGRDLIPAAPDIESDSSSIPTGGPWEGWRFAALSDFEARRLGKMPQERRAARIDESIDRVIDQGLYIEALEDDARVYEYVNDDWVATDRRTKAVDEALALYITNTGDKTLSTDEFNENFRSKWNAARKGSKRRPEPEKQASEQDAAEADRQEVIRRARAQMNETLQAGDAQFDVPERSPVSAIDAAATETDTTPTDAQKEAGNYKKGKVRIQGLEIAIENPKGSTRSGTDPDGNRWESTMVHHYGDIKGTKAADGDNLDVFIGPDPEIDQVFVIDQPNADGSFDEHKIMLGFANEKAAREGYLANYEDGWKVGPITRMTTDEFKAWMKDGDTTKPLAESKPDQDSEAAETAATQQSEPESPETTQEATGQPIEDFGEKIEGARKDYASKLAEAKDRDVSAVPLSQSWPEPKYQKMLDEGAPAETVALVRALRDEVPTKPQKGWKLKGWVEMVTGLRDLASTLMENQNAANKVVEQIRAMKSSNRTAREAKHVLGRMELYLEFGHEDSFKGITFGESFYQMYMGEKNVAIWEVERLSKATAFGNMPRTLATGKTREEALENLRKALDKLPESTKEGKAVRFNIYRDRYSNDVFIGKKIGKDVVRMRTFDDDVKAARKYLDENQRELEAELERMKKIPAHRRKSNSPRVGTDHRNGGDVTPDAFAESFGFRGVQFGNYVEQGRRQADLNEAYDALMDLAGILDIPAKAISLNGELGLAFGARGKGGKNAPMAHYEPGTVVINLTKKSGAGSLAHEWFHSLDNYFGRSRGGKSADRFATRGEPDTAVRPEVVEAFRNVKQTVNRIRMKERSRSLDKMRTKPYWSTDVEMTARAFESYVIEQLKDQGASNDYLANIVSEDYWKASEALGMQDSGSYPYPEAAEIPDVRAAYDNLFQVIETRETENGSVEMYSRDGEFRRTPEYQRDALTVEQAESIRDELMSGWKGAPDIIIRDQISQFPNRLQAAIRQAGAESDMRGVLWNDTVYLLASRIPDRTRMEQVILHEVVGHYGLRKMLGKKLERVLDQIWLTHGGQTRANFIIERYYPGNTFDVNNKEHRHTVSEELIAHLAEQNRGQTLVQRAVAIIREGLRKLGFTLEFTVDDIVNLLRKARATVENGGFETPTNSAHIAAATSRVSESEKGDENATEAVPPDPAGNGRSQAGLSRGNGSTDEQASSEGGDRNGERVDAARSEVGGDSSDGVIPPGFRFSRAGIPDLDPQPFGPPSDTLIRRLVSKIADKHTVLKGVQKNIQDQFGEIPDPANAYRAEELFHGKVENDVRLIQENMVEPLAKEMSENDVSLKQLDEFLYALHAPERNRVIAERNPKIPEGGSGMTDAEAAAIIAKVEKEGKLKQYQALAKRVHDMLAMRRKILKSAGLLDEDTVGAWEASYTNYVPLKGWAADEQQSDMPRIGKGFAIAGKESQMAAGRKSKAASPLANTISDLSEAVLRRRKNEVGQSFMNLVQAYPNDNYWRIYTDENPEVERKAVRVKDPATGKMKVEVREQTIPMAMMSDRYFTTKVDGKTHYIKIEDQRLMNAMRNIGPDNSNLLIRSLAAVTRIMSSLNTSYNPEFVISNFSRDIQTALLNLTSEQSSEDGKARGKKIAAKTLKDVATSIRAINASLKGKTLKGKAGEWQARFDQFRADGAKTGWFDMKDIDGQMKDLERMISLAGGSPLSIRGLRRGFNIITDWVENTNSAIENGVRLSAYVNAIEAGIPRSQAASLAKNMTVNFNRKGELGTMMNALYMFANASVQGTANFVRTLGRLNGVKGDPMLRRMHTAQKIAVGMAVGGFALSMLNRLVAGEDDDEVNWWDKVPDYIKERNIVIMKSLVGGEPGEYWTIPLPYGYNIFPVIGTSMEHMAFSDKSAGDIAGNVVLAALGSFSPIGFEESQEAYGVIAKNIMPTILRPVASISLNENFMGGPIFKENFPFGTQKPDSALYFRSTPEAFKELAEGLNEATGGSEFRSGAVDLSPDVMQFLVGYYGGGAYDFFTSRSPSFLTKLATGVELEDREIPFIRKLTGSVLPYEDQSIFYDRRNEIQQLADERKNLKGRERIEFSKDYREKLRLQGVMKSTEDRLKMLRKQRDRVEVMDLSAAEEDEKLQRIEKQMKRAIDQFNKRYNEAEG